MGLTYEEAKACGIAHLWPSQASKIAIPEAAPPPSRFVGDRMNKLERAFWERLQAARSDGIFRDIYREPLKLRLAGNTFYTPDFLTYSPFNGMHLWETKGYMREDAAIKLKVAASMYPSFAWVLVQRDRGRWRCINVTDRGFAREEWCPDWLR
jgi:hypothetical protein